VTDKLAPNLYILQGSPDLDMNHPDAAGGRVAVLFGPDGILMVDSRKNVTTTGPYRLAVANNG
jgi:cyclase